MPTTGSESTAASVTEIARSFPTFSFLLKKRSRHLFCKLREIQNILSALIEIIIMLNNNSSSMIDKVLIERQKERHKERGVYLRQ